MTNETTIISIAFEKGGVAKTATTFTVGSDLAERGYKVLLIDADPQGSLTICFGVDKDEIECDISTLIECEINDEVYPDEEKYMIHFGNNLDLIPAKSDLKFVKEEMERSDDRDNILKYIISEINTKYDFIIIDNNPSLNLLSKNALIASNKILITAIPDKLSSDGINETLKTISKIKRRLNKDLDIAGILFTMTNANTINDKQYINQCKEDYQKFAYFFNSTIPRSTEFQKALTEKKTIFKYNKKNAVASAYKEFTNELLERLNSK